MLSASGGLKQVLSARRLAASDGPIRVFLDKYDAISPSERKRLPIEAIALAAGMDIEALLGSILFALHRQNL